MKSVTVPIVSPSTCHEVMDQMPWSSVSESWVLSQFFHSALSPSSSGSLILLHFLPLGWCHLHIWGDFKSYSLRNMLTIAARDGDSSLGSGQNKLKTFLKGFTILNVIKEIHERGQNININRSLEEVDPTLMDDFEGFKISYGGGNCRCGGINKRTWIRNGTWRCN